MTPLTEIRVEALKRQFPHVDQVEDWAAKQTIRLLWDRIFDLEGRLQSAEANVRQLTETSNTQDATLANARRDIDAALAQIQGLAAEASGLVGWSDLGEGAAGCAAPYATGHPGGTVDLTAEEAGKVVCGTGTEWASLCAIAADAATRTANNVEFIERCIWHLQQAGFTAGRQRNPSGIISVWHLSVYVLLNADVGTPNPPRLACYRVVGYEEYTAVMVPVFDFHDPTDAGYEVSAGIAD